MHSNPRVCLCRNSFRTVALSAVLKKLEWVTVELQLLTSSITLELTLYFNENEFNACI